MSRPAASVARFFEVLDHYLAHQEREELSDEQHAAYMRELESVRAELTEAENAEIDAKLNSRLERDHAPDRRFLERGDGRRMYATAIECFWPRYRIEVFQIHAHDAGEARAHWCALYPAPRYRVVACGLSLGFFAEDRDGKKLVA